MKNLEQRKGLKNRHTDGLPKEKCVIRIVTKFIDDERIFLCEWQPFNKNEHTEINMPQEGYLGSARVIYGNPTGIGFNAWEQNNNEFIWYDVVFPVAPLSVLGLKKSDV